MLHRGSPETGGEERAADLALSLEQLLGPIPQLTAAKAEHRGKVGLADSAEEWQERRVRQRVAGLIQKRVLVPLAALEDEPVPRPVFDLAKQAQALVVMQEVVGGLAVNAEEQISDRPQQRTLACLVLTIDEVQITSVSR